MTFSERKQQSVSAWSRLAHGNRPAPVAAPASGVATLLQQGAVARQQRSELSWYEVEFVNFSADTLRFLSVTEGDIRTGLRHGTRHVGKLLYQMGATREEFVFASPESDLKSLKRGIIRGLWPVKESEILQILSDAGVFDAKNKSHYNSDRYAYIWREGQGKGSLDFSTGHLAKAVKANIYANSEAGFSPYLFYLEGVAHNYFNFGNFLYGAAGAALGLKVAELTAGAHVNSLVHSDTNGYDPQLDSTDDQFSIVLGYEHAKKRNYAERTSRWVKPKWGLPRLPQ